MLVIFLCVCLSGRTFGETADKYKQLLLDKHNDFRRKEGTSNMNELVTVKKEFSVTERFVWNDTLAKEADAWISRCEFKHEMKGRGENLAYSAKTDDVSDIEEAMQDWYDEIKDYNYNGKACRTSCHYTQLVWSSTREVGCAIRTCPSLNRMKNAWYIGCWYDPQGNDMSEYPYLIGEPCSKCLEGQTCKDELCAGGKPRVCKDHNPLCNLYKSICESSKSWMTLNCAKTCGFCWKKRKKCVSGVCISQSREHGIFHLRKEN